MLRFKRMRSLQKFSAVHACVYNHFNQEHFLTSRSTFKKNRATALTEWRGLCAEYGTAIPSAPWDGFALVWQTPPDQPRENTLSGRAW